MKTDWKAFLTDAGAEFEGDGVVHFGNPEREKRVSVSGLVFADLGHYGVIAVHGADAGNFLQAQLSNAVGNLDAGHSQLNAYCTPKGRMLEVENPNFVARTGAITPSTTILTCTVWDLTDKFRLTARSPKTRELMTSFERRTGVMWAWGLNSNRISDHES